MLQRSVMLFAGQPDPVGRLLSEWLEALGWRTKCIADTGNVLAEARDAAARLLIIGPDVDDAAVLAITRGVRGFDDFGAGMPILLCDTERQSLAGANALLPLPLIKSTALEVLVNWAGPLEDHDFRSPANARYQHVRMMGLAESERLFNLFVRSLEQSLRDLENGGDVRQIAHNIAGISGMMGYADLNRIWAAIDRSDVVQVDDARDKTIAFLEEQGWA